MSSKKNLAKITYIFTALIVGLAFFAFSSISAAQAGDDDFTIGAWVRAASSTANLAIVVKDNEARLITDASGRPACQIHNGTAWQTAVTANNSLTLNQWKFVACVYDGSNLKIYLDGAESGSRAETNSVYNTTNPWRIGSDASGSYNDFTGFIDEVKIYPYARTPQEIRMDFAAGQAGVRSNHGVSAAFGAESDSWLTDGLVGYWKLDETATTSGAADSSGNGNTGTFYGNASTTAGKFGRGGVFDGDGDWIDVGDQDYFSPAENNLTIAFWAQTPSTAAPVGSGDCGDAGAYFITKGMSNSDWEWGVENDNNSKLCLVLWQSNGVDHAKIEVNYSINDDAWHYYTAVINYLNQVSFYLDGVLIGETKSFTGTMVNGNDNVLFGRRGDNSYFFNGKIDEVRIYNRALSPDEVRKLYEWAPGPVLHLKFDEKSGTTTYDSSGYGNDGTIYGASWTRGKYGGALSFDGSDDYVDTGADQSLLLGKQMTISVWMKSTQNDRQEVLVSATKGIWGDSLYYLSIGYPSAGYIFFWREEEDGTDFTIQSNSQILDTNWHHITAVHDGTNFIIYIDGIQDKIEDKSGYSDIPDSITHSFVGHQVENWGTAWDFSGLIDDVRIYNYALTQKQILEVMNGGDPSRPGRAHKSPVLYLSFDEGQGETAHDSNPVCKDLNTNCNNGTLYPGTGGSNTATSAMWSLEGKQGRGVELDGTDDYISIPDFSY